MSDRLLVIDNGTQSVRALVFDLRGNILEKVRVPIVPYVTPKPNWAEQDPDYFWKKLCEALQKLWQLGTIDKESIAAIALTTQRNTLINVDKQGRPLRPAIHWLDQRRVTDYKPIGGLWGLAFQVAGIKDTSNYVQSEAEANWIAQYQPEIWEQTHKFLFLSGYLNYRLTGQFIDSVGNQVGYVPFDYKRLDWARSWDWKWQVAPITKDILPDLVPPAGVIGTVSRIAARDTGLPIGLPVIAAAADKACEVTGSGCLDPHIGCLSYGTTATINTTHKKYIEVIPLIPPYPSAVPGHYSLEVQVFRGYWMVNWFKEEFGQREIDLAAEKGVEPENLFESLIEKVPPGSEGLVLQPFWTPGLRVPGPEARGAIIGFSDVHTRAHMYRAMLEGIAYALREGKERTEKRSGVPVTQLRVSGGGSQSDGALQLTADIFGLPVSRPHTYETSGLGAAIDAAVGMGLHKNFTSAMDAMTRLGDTFEPDPARQQIYDELYKGVYSKMYNRLRPLYQQMGSIIGLNGDAS